MYLSQAYKGLIDYQSKEQSKRMYMLTSVKPSEDPVNCNIDKYHNLINLSKICTEDYN
jgi:hypothetical protein